MNAREKHLQDDEEHLQRVIAPYERDENEEHKRRGGERPPTPWYARKKPAPAKPFVYPRFPARRTG